MTRVYGGSTRGGSGRAARARRARGQAPGASSSTLESRVLRVNERLCGLTPDRTGSGIRVTWQVPLGTPRPCTEERGAGGGARRPVLRPRSVPCVTPTLHELQTVATAHDGPARNEQSPRAHPGAHAFSRWKHAQPGPVCDVGAPHTERGAFDGLRKSASRTHDPAFPCPAVNSTRSALCGLCSPPHGSRRWCPSDPSR